MKNQANYKRIHGEQNPWCMKTSKVQEHDVNEYFGAYRIFT